ncbi:MAG: hypothetical protein A2033_19300 [Bacteroidetes bacterium GWA2_31_9]|nr:MAG: hypothetical protein A2033_19300 [Bacteroidetes bacterium GWA2_31_9]
MKGYYKLLYLLWGLFIAVAFFINVSEHQENIEEIALSKGRTLFNQILVTRQWNSKNGGVYIPISDSIQPNPYLDVPEKNIVSSDNIHYTLINPAYMTRLISEIANRQNEEKFHITSLKPLNPNNKADIWEEIALKSFENGELEAFIKADSGVESIYRYMAPLKVENSCMRCHSKQGYRIGDIRGGISISFNTKQFDLIAFKHVREEIIFYLIFGLLGFILLLVIDRLMVKNIRELNSKQKQLEQEIEERKLTEYKLYETVEELEASSLQLFKQNAFLDKVINSFSYPFFVINADDYKIELMNIEAQKIFDNSSHKLCYNIINKLDKPCSKGNVECPIEKLRNGADVVSFEKTIKVNNEIKYFEVKSFPVLDDNNKLKTIIEFYFDITKRKEQEIKIKEHIEELNTKSNALQEANLMLRKSEIQLKELNQTKDKFFSIIAHDLKNPFNAIMNSSYLLLKHGKGYDEEKLFKFIKLINTSSNQAYNLLENLLHWSRKQTGRLVKSPEILEISKLIEEEISNLNNLLENKQISLKTLYSENNTAYCDANMIKTVIRNLLTNAIKYSHRNSEIVISILDTNDNVTVSIKDNGIGMTDEVIQNLFKIESEESLPGTENERGTGLGLILCKEFVEENRGELTIVSEPEKGSTFSFTIPTSKFLIE